MKASDLAGIPVLGYALRWGMELLKLPIIREHAVADIRAIRQEITAIDGRRSEREERLSLQEDRLTVQHGKLAAHQEELLSQQKKLTELTAHGVFSTAQQYWENTLKEPRYADPKRLQRFGWKAYSQNEEDGIINEIFRRIGEGARTFVEIGTEAGHETNTVVLLLSGWRGLWIEANESTLNMIRTRLGRYCESGALRVANVFITRENVEQTLQLAAQTTELSLLSIDIDGNDYWIWDAIESVRPRVIVIEYNATWHPPLSFVVSYADGFRWDGSNYFGASLSALERLGERKGYRLVGCCFAGVNAFFVREDLCGDHFCAPYTAENHYEPPRYGMIRPSGHPPAVGVVENR